MTRFPIKSEPGRIILLEKDQIYYVKADGDDTLVRAARKKLYEHIEPLEEAEARMLSLPFLQIHRSYIVNLDRVYELRRRSENDWALRMDPPVNKVLPVSRDRISDLWELLGN